MTRLLALLTAGLLAAPVPPATSAPDSPATPEVLELVASSLETLGASQVMVAAARSAEEGERAYPYIVPAGDLDSDGSGDVLTVTRIPDEEDGLGSRVVLTARRGADGEILWTLPTGTVGFTATVPAPVGEDGGPGLLLVSYEVEILLGSIGGTTTAEHPYGGYMGGQVRATVLAVSGDGEVVWRYDSPSGRFLYPPLVATSEPVIAENVPIVPGTLRATSSKATDVLLAVYDRTPTAEGQDDRVRTFVFDGADGAQSPAAVTDIAGTRTVVEPAPDLDGDGLDDYTILVDAVSEGAIGGLQARRGTDGTALWTTERDVSWTQQRLLAVGDATGDGIEDLALRYISSLPAPFGSQVGTRTVSLLDGATGAEVWQHPGDAARRLGDVTGDGLAEVLVVRVARSSTSVGLRYQARTAAGIAWTAEHLMPAEGATQTSLTFADAGDVDLDLDEDDDGNPLEVTGRPDFAHHLRLLDDSADLVREDARVISGRTGETLREGPLGGQALRTTLDGEGDDLVVIQPWSASARDVTAADGLTGSPLWSARLRVRGETGVNGFFAVAAELDGDGRAELIVNASSRTTAPPVPSVGGQDEAFVDAWVLSGRDGSILWHSDPLAEPGPPPPLSGKTEPGQPFTWEGTTASGHSATWSLRAECSPDDPLYRCDHALVEFANPPAPGEPTRTATAAVLIGGFGPVPSPVTDFDLYVYESDEFGTKGELIDYAFTVDDPERVDFELTTTAAEPSRYVLVEVTYYTSVESTYTGTASIEATEE